MAKERESTGGGPGGGGSGKLPGRGNLDKFKKDAERLASAGDDALDRAMSGDSEAFLRANKQQGGE